MVELAPLKAVAVFVVFAALFLAERRWPAVTAPGGTRIGRNLGLWGLNAVASALVLMPVALWAAGHPWLDRPIGWRGPVAFALDLVLLDLWVWAWHVANHRVPILWRFHRVHHYDEHLDTTTAVRFHLGEVLLSAVVRMPIILGLAVPITTVVVFEALLLVLTVFHHSNLRLPPGFERALAPLIVTPGIHWVHHHADPRDTNRNFATILSVWDRIFATRSPTVRFPSMPIGLQGEPDRSWIALCLAPFRSAQRPPNHPG